MNNSGHFSILVEFTALTYILTHIFFYSYGGLVNQAKANIFRPHWSKIYSFSMYLQRIVCFLVFKKQLKKKWNPIFKKSSYISKKAYLKTNIIDMFKLKKFKGTEKKGGYKRYEKKHRK